MFGFKKNRISISPLKDFYQGADTGSNEFLIFRNGILYSIARDTTLDPSPMFKWDGVSMTTMPTKSSTGDTIQNLSYIGKIGIYEYYRGYIEGLDYFMAFFRWDGISETMERMPDSNYTTTGSSMVTSSTKVFIAGTDIFFEASSLGGNNRLFKLDTLALTVTQITDNVYAGNQTIEIRYFMNGKLYFTALVNASFHRKLFVYDGTTVTQVAETFVGGSDAPAFRGVIGDRIYYTASIATSIIKNFYIDTLTNNVTRLPDTRSLTGNDNPTSHIIVEDKLFFVANNPSLFTKLYCWDGLTLASLNINPGGNDAPSGFKAFNGYLYCSISTSTVPSYIKLFGWDGTDLIIPPETYPGSNDSTIVLSSTPLGVYYRANLPSSGFSKLFFWDGVTRSQIAETRVGGNDNPTNPTNLSVDGNIYYYVSAISSTVNQLFKVEGTIRTQITSFASSISAFYYQKLGVGFYMTSGSSGLSKLYKWDGSSLLMAPEISPGQNESFYNIIVSDSSDKVAFRAIKPVDPGFTSEVIFTWDGTNLQEVPPTSFRTFTTASVEKISNGKDLVYFEISTSDIPTRRRLMAYDGNKFTNVPPINPTSSDSYGSGNIIGNRYYFSNRTGTLTDKAHYFDISTGVRTQMPEVRPNLDDVTWSQFVEFLGEIYYGANDTSGNAKLVKYNPTSNTVTIVSNTRPGSSDNPEDLIVAGGSLYFSAFNSSGFTKLFRYNGTTITQVSNTRPTGSDSPRELFVRGSSVMFVASNSSGFDKLYQVTGSTVVQVPEVVSGANDNLSNFSSEYLVIGNDFYYKAGINLKVYRWNGTTRTQVSNTYPAGSDNPSGFSIDSNNNLYFSSVINASGHKKVFKWNGTTLTQPWDSTNPTGSDGDRFILMKLGDKGYIMTLYDSTNVNRHYFWDGTSSKLDGPIAVNQLSGYGEITFVSLLGEFKDGILARSGTSSPYSVFIIK
jgi:hypothetical protein